MNHENLRKALAELIAPMMPEREPTVDDSECAAIVAAVEADQKAADRISLRMCEDCTRVNESITTEPCETCYLHDSRPSFTPRADT